jgi:hypothetical protein
VDEDKWTCLASARHSVAASTEGGMLLSPAGLLVAGRVGEGTTWRSEERR